MDFEPLRTFVLFVCMLVAGIQLEYRNLCVVAFMFAYFTPTLDKHKRGRFAVFVVVACVVASTRRCMM